MNPYQQQTLDHKDVDNYYPLHRLLLDDIEEVSMNDDVEDLLNNNMISVNDIVYDDESDDTVKEVLVNDDKSGESDIEEDLVDDMLEDSSFDFEGFDGEYDPYFPNFTSAIIFIWITK